MKCLTARSAAPLLVAVIGLLVPTFAVAETVTIVCKNKYGSPWSIDVDFSARTVGGAGATITDQEIKWSVPALHATYVLNRTTGILSTWDNSGGPTTQECTKATKKF